MDLADQMQDPAFWRRVAPTLNTDGLAIGPKYEVDARQLEFAYEEIVQVGYGQLDNVLPADDVADALKAVQAVRNAGLLPIYAFAYDETWSIYLRLANVWRRVLGPEWQFMPAVWTWWIDQGVRHAGFPAHRDRGKQVSVRPDGSPMTLSAWVPLTRAIPANGCMYVMPNDLPWEKLDLDTCRKIRALPCVPGTVLMWNQSVWHWSGTSSPRAQNPRVSMAFELQCSPQLSHGEVFQGPLLDPTECPPPLHRRLTLIAQQVLQYRHLTRLDGAPVALADALMKYA